MPGRFTLGERAPGTQWIGGWVDPRTSLDDVMKRIFLTLSRLKLRPFCRPASSQSLYRLRYPPPFNKKNSVALVRKRTVLTERQQHIGEVSAKFADRGCRVVSATDPNGC
jgi:hypothetical protein